MHSRIFQISKETIDVSDYIEASDIPEGFQSGIADYVVDVEEPHCGTQMPNGVFRRHLCTGAWRRLLPGSPPMGRKHTSAAAISDSANSAR